jgi:N6-L-threonylcarbamoyladenine synthase
MIILGIESSCDDTAAAILESDSTLHASIISSQDVIHSRFGGVVPELASRRHMEVITTVVDEAFSKAGLHHNQIDLVAVTQGPGLIGSLLVGFSYAKSLSYTLGIPFVGVDHMAGHLLSAFLEDDVPTFPYLALIVSGGTSSLLRVDNFFDFSLLGRTRDDAAGEAFDKVARLLGLGYPGGPFVAGYALDGDSSRFKLPRAWLEEGSLDFSFSGLKTAVMNTYNKNKRVKNLTLIPDLCAAFQDAVVDVLVEKTIRAASELNIDSIVLGGGVSANIALRQRMEKRCNDENRKLFLPAPQNCTDNAAMIAYAGMKQFENGVRGSMDDDVFSRSSLGQ